MKTKKYKIWSYFEAQTILEWKLQYQKLWAEALIIPHEHRKKPIHKDLFKTMYEIKNFLQSKGVKFI
jgi:hypothetical protein